MGIRERISIERAPIGWAQEVVTRHHYLHRPVHPLALPFAYAIRLDGQVVGTIIMAAVHFTRLRGLFGYPGLPTKWQVLQVARVWITPEVQGQTVTDSRGRTHTMPIASRALALMLRRVQRDWLEHHPPRFPDRPYHIRLVLAYADTGQGHEGTIYKAANFKFWGITRNNRRRHGTRGSSSGTVKLLYVYELPEPRWQPPLQLTLPIYMERGG